MLLVVVTSALLALASAQPVQRNLFLMNNGMRTPWTWNSYLYENALGDSIFQNTLAQRQATLNGRMGSEGALGAVFRPNPFQFQNTGGSIPFVYTVPYNEGALGAIFPNNLAQQNPFSQEAALGSVFGLRNERALGAVLNPLSQGLGRQNFFTGFSNENALGASTPQNLFQYRNLMRPYYEAALGAATSQFAYNPLQTANIWQNRGWQEQALGARTGWQEQALGARTGLFQAFGNNQEQVMGDSIGFDDRNEQALGSWTLPFGSRRGYGKRSYGYKRKRVY